MVAEKVVNFSRIKCTPEKILPMLMGHLYLPEMMMMMMMMMLMMMMMMFAVTDVMLMLTRSPVQLSL